MTIGPIVVMGVSGSGKSTVGTELAVRLGVPFADADDLHPASNVAKMAAGVPLDDADRMPWLDLVGAWLARNPRGVISCSALRRRYRNQLRAHAPSTFFVHLAGDREVIAHRQSARTGHFMPASLLDSQFASLEPLEPDEPGVVVDVGLPAEQIVDDVVRRVLR
ncbi:gluconokinase [Gordonia bronchialis]|jgi:gluconokinase|uniref:gluconokinase n=1 Tax=Gordonia bronchialis TaxID=2054 RepID=UPI00242E7DC3|nr:gluconokinase [Gordonia bronchialis]